jgi:transcriptional regulator with XRE-family HTH domain
VPVLTRLRSLRERQVLSQRDLAEKARISPATVVRAEKGEPMRYLTTRKLADALGITPEELVDRAQDLESKTAA